MAGMHGEILLYPLVLHLLSTLLSPPPPLSEHLEKVAVVSPRRRKDVKMKHASFSSLWERIRKTGLEWIRDLLVLVVVFFTRFSTDPTSDVTDKEKHFKWVYLWVQMFMLLLISLFPFQAMLISLPEVNSLFSQL